VTLVETITANGTTISPVVIVQGRTHMANWYIYLEDPETRVLLSDSGFTNSELALQYLHHLISYTNATAEYPKVLLMDQHGSCWYNR
jgi:hypothetical protein